LTAYPWTPGGRFRPGIPLADARLLRRPALRSRLVRVLLAAALLATLAAAFFVARGMPVHHSSFFPAGESGVVVLDFSTSIDQPGYRRISNVLRPVVEANQPIGIVYFSDVAYVALPPGTPGRELRPFLRFLRTPAPPGQFPTRADVDRAIRFEPLESPWAAAFRGGTRISQGLEVARDIVEREGIEGTVLLISDLDDSLFDVPELGATLAGFRRDRIDLRVVPLFPSDDDRAFFREALGPGAFVTHAELLRNAQASQERSLQADFPVPLLLLGVGLIGLVALNELLCGRLEWRRPRAGEVRA
jgi:hypothetical protein